MENSAITSVSGHAIVLRGNDIDTDRIIPARFLKTVTFDGLDANVFFDDRAAMRRDGGVHPFDAPASIGATMLIVNKNFGCGSSREHAPQALYRRGFRAVVGESFADIFFSNSLMIGLACVSLGADDIESLMKIVEGNPALVVAVNLESGVATAGGKSWPIQLPPHARHALISGQWDGAGLLLQNYADVEAVDAKLPYSF
ncbi:MAG: 3-isopropylmalate dehydratase small subunit [Acidobacteria bacterium]|nr:MAG: 3-isopropylmalate dehydratase small subunit [Acidobacteriota bacterium]